MVILFSMPIEAQAAGSVSTNGPFLKSNSYVTSSVLVDGLADQNGYFSFNVTTPSGSMIWISRRHNADDLDIVLASNETGFIAVTWRNTMPDNPTVDEYVNSSNVIIGSNGQVRDDTGFANGVHSADVSSKIINSTVFTDSMGIKMQFTYPLNDTDPINQGLSAGYYGFFTFATGSTASLDVKFDGESNSMYVPWVYIGTWMDISYWPPETTSTPFSEPIVIILAFFFIPVVRKLKK